MNLTPLNQTAKEDAAVVPWHQFPIWRANKAAQKGNEKNLLMKTWGGIGDVICAIPTVMFAVENFKDCNITVVTHHPDLFKHIEGLHDIYDLKIEQPIYDDYLVFDCIPNQREDILAEQFYSHMHTHCVDFPSLIAFRSQLPIKAREVKIVVPTPMFADSAAAAKILEIAHEKEKYVIVHAGRHWQSKTFPVAFWDAVLDSIIANGLTPVLIGKHDGETQGYVETKTEGCIDLRDDTSLRESIFLLQNAAVVFCNDSSPLHMAVTGDAFIGFIASVKHPDFITHYRKGLFGWRMENHSKDGMWNHSSICPNVIKDVLLDNVDPKLIESFLPDPATIGPWCKEKMSEYLSSGKV